MGRFGRKLGRSRANGGKIGGEGQFRGRLCMDLKRKMLELEDTKVPGGDGVADRSLETKLGGDGRGRYRWWGSG